MRAVHDPSKVFAKARFKVRPCYRTVIERGHHVTLIGVANWELVKVFATSSDKFITP